MKETTYYYLLMGLLVVSTMVRDNRNSKLETSLENLKNPVSIIQEDRNEDGILDQVIKYKNGSEYVFYGRESEDGSISYSK